MGSVIVVIREISKSTGIAQISKNSLLFSLFSGNFETASLRMIGGGRVDAAVWSLPASLIIAPKTHLHVRAPAIRCDTPGLALQPFSAERPPPPC